MLTLNGEGKCKSMEEMAGTSSHPHNVFRDHYGNIQQAITSAESLAGLLYSDRLISEGTKNKVNSISSAGPIEKASCVLDAVEKTLVASSQPEDVLYRLCDVLKLSGEPALEEIAGRMQSSVSGKHPNVPISTLF